MSNHIAARSHVRAFGTPGIPGATGGAPGMDPATIDASPADPDGVELTVNGDDRGAIVP